MTQESLGLAVPQSSADRIAEQMLEKKNELAELRDELDSVEQNLIDALKIEKRTSIQIDGKTLYIDHIEEQDRIKIRKTLKHQ